MLAKYRRKPTSNFLLINTKNNNYNSATEYMEVDLELVKVSGEKKKSLNF